MKKLNIAFIHPFIPKTEEYPFAVSLGPLKLEAYCRDIATFDFYLLYFDGDPNDYDAFAITSINGIYDDLSVDLLKLIHNLKQYNLPILLGGNYPRYRPEIESQVDWVCYYEGEKPLRRALLNILNNEPLVHSKIHEPLTCEELDLIPPLETFYYKEIGIMPIQLGIGCPNNCIFCDSWGSQGKKLRHPSLNKMISDISFYHSNGINCFYLVDDCIFFDKKYYMEIFNYIKKLGMKIIFPYISPYIKEDELELVTELSYLKALSLNVDACNERTYLLAKKRDNFKNIPNIVNYIKNKGLRVIIQIVVNFPFETDEDRREAIEYYSNLNIDDFEAMALEPIIGTPVYDMITEDLFTFRQKGIALSNYMNHAIRTNLKNEIKSFVYYTNS